MLPKESKEAEKPDSPTNARLRIQEIYATGLHIKAPEKVMDAIRDFFTDSDSSDPFASAEEKSIGQHVREARVNKLKELLVYTDFSTDEICSHLHYHSAEEMESDLIEQTGLNLLFYQNLKTLKASLVRRSALKKLTPN